MVSVRPDQPLLAAAFGVLDAIRSRGRIAVIAGGAVRDHVLGRTLTDADIATDMPLAELAALFTTHAVGRSRQFETVVVVHCGRAVEVTRFRGSAGGATRTGRGGEGGVRAGLLRFPDERGRVRALGR